MLNFVKKLRLKFCLCNIKSLYSSLSLSHVGPFQSVQQMAVGQALGNRSRKLTAKTYQRLVGSAFLRQKNAAPGPGCPARPIRHQQAPQQRRNGPFWTCSGFCLWFSHLWDTCLVRFSRPPPRPAPTPFQWRLPVTWVLFLQAFETPSVHAQHLGWLGSSSAEVMGASSCVWGSSEGVAPVTVAGSRGSRWPRFWARSSRGGCWTHGLRMDCGWHIAAPEGVITPWLLGFGMDSKFFSTH